MELLPRNVEGALLGTLRGAITRDPRCPIAFNRIHTFRQIFFACCGVAIASGEKPRSECMRFGRPAWTCAKLIAIGGFYQWWRIELSPYFSWLFLAARHEWPKWDEVWNLLMIERLFGWRIPWMVWNWLLAKVVFRRFIAICFTQLLAASTSKFEQCTNLRNNILKAFKDHFFSRLHDQR